MQTTSFTVKMRKKENNVIGKGYESRGFVVCLIDYILYINKYWSYLNTNEIGKRKKIYKGNLHLARKETRIVFILGQ